MARKSGDASVVFGVLALIRQEPAFGSVDSDTQSVYLTYAPPVASVRADKLEALIPMLFLARFDPYISVRDVMRALWDMLVTHEYQIQFRTVLQEQVVDYLCQQLTCTNWRDREASCAALETYLVQRSWSVLRPRLLALWNGGMSVLDDVRDTTRMAAIGYVYSFTP